MENRSRASKGETLIETLVATLIIALTSVLLLTMTMAAVRINAASDKAGKQYRQELATAEQGGGTREGKVTIRVGSRTYDYDVLYSGDSDQLHSYDKKEVSGP